MNIVFVTENNFLGPVPEKFNNLRTEFAWMKMFDAFHVPYQEVIKNPDNSYIDTTDFVLFIPSKSHPEYLEAMFRINKPFGIIQEGPNYLWQDWDINYQMMYLAIIRKRCSVLFVHNQIDKDYYEGITTKPVYVLRTVNNPVTYVVNEFGGKVLVGGTMCSWYGGMNSYLAIKDITSIKKICIPSMGRKRPNEEEVMNLLDKRVSYLPYMSLDDFLQELSTYYFAVHLMPTAAAGSLSLNCAMVGIPCIGNKDDDTQRILFPDLSVNVLDVKKAKELANKLVNDKSFYSEVTTKALNSLDDFMIHNNKEKYLTIIGDLINARR